MGLHVTLHMMAGFLRMFVNLCFARNYTVATTFGKKIIRSKNGVLHIFVLSGICLFGTKAE